MDTWEYEYVPIATDSARGGWTTNGTDHFATIQEVLNVWGAQGWELVDVLMLPDPDKIYGLGFYAFFKRRKD